MKSLEAGKEIDKWVKEIKTNGSSYSPEQKAVNEHLIKLSEMGGWAAVNLLNAIFKSAKEAPDGLDEIAKEGISWQRVADEPNFERVYFHPDTDGFAILKFTDGSYAVFGSHVTSSGITAYDFLGYESIFAWTAYPTIPGVQLKETSPNGNCEYFRPYRLPDRMKDCVSRVSCA